MKYEIEFKQTALKEWKKLDNTIKELFRKKLKKIIDNPCVFANALRNMPNCYKIKLRNIGYRLVYEVKEHEITVLSPASGCELPRKRERPL